MFWNKKTIDGLVYIKSNGNWVLKPDIQKTYEEHKNHSSYYYNGNKIRKLTRLQNGLKIFRTI